MPDIELLPSAKDQAAEDLLLIDPARHQVFRDPAWHWFERCQEWAGPQVNLGVYRHRETGRFVLGAWAYPPTETDRPILQELEGFNGDPHELWPFDLPPEVMRIRLRPVHDGLERVQRQINQKTYNRNREREEDLHNRGEAARTLRRRGLDKEAHDLDRGAVPFRTPRATPKGDSLTTQLGELAKGV